MEGGEVSRRNADVPREGAARTHYGPRNRGSLGYNALGALHDLPHSCACTCLELEKT